MHRPHDERSQLAFFFHGCHFGWPRALSIFPSSRSLAPRALSKLGVLLRMAPSASGQYRSSTISTSRTASRTTGSQGNKCLIFWRWRTTSFSGVSQRSRTPTALQRSNRGKCAHLLRDLDATADLPPHCPLFALQLLDLTYRWWSEFEGSDI